MAIGALLQPWSLLGFLAALMALWWACRVLESTLIVPRRLGRALQSQGLRGTTYRFPFGDLKELARLAMAARAKPMPLSHDITPRVNRLYYNVIREHGKHVTVFNSKNRVRSFGSVFPLLFFVVVSSLSKSLFGTCESFL